MRTLNKAEFKNMPLLTSKRFKLSRIYKFLIFNLIMLGFIEMPVFANSGKVTDPKKTPSSVDLTTSFDEIVKDKNLSEMYFVFGQQRSSYSLERSNSNLADFQIVLGTVASYFNGEKSKEVPVQDQILGAAGVIKNWFGQLISTLKPKGSLSFDLGFLPKETSQLSDDFRSRQKQSYLQEFNKKCEFRVRKNVKDPCSQAERDNALVFLPQGFDTKRRLFEPLFLSQKWPSLKEETVALFDKKEIAKHLGLVGGIANIDTLEEGNVRAKIQLLIRLPRAVVPVDFQLPGYAFLDNFVIPSGSNGGQDVYALLQISLMAHPEFFSNQETVARVSMQDATAYFTFGDGFWLNPKDFGIFEITKVPPNSELKKDFALRVKHSKQVAPDLVDLEIPYVGAHNITVPRNKVPKYWPTRQSFVMVADFGKLGLEGIEVDLLMLEVRRLNLRAQLMSNNSVWNTILMKLSEWWLNSESGYAGRYLDKLLVDAINRSLAKKRAEVIDKINKTMHEISEVSSGVSDAWYVQNKASSFLDYSNTLREKLCEGQLSGSPECR